MATSIPWSDVVGLDGFLDGVKIATKRKQVPVMLMVKNGALWTQAAKLLARLRLESNKLPDEGAIEPA